MFYFLLQLGVTWFRVGRILLDKKKKKEEMAYDIRATFTVYDSSDPIQIFLDRTM